MPISIDKDTTDSFTLDGCIVLKSKLSTKFKVFKPKGFTEILLELNPSKKRCLI